MVPLKCMPKISFLILTYNSSNYVVRLLSSIFEILHEEIVKDEIEIIVFDNASVDNTVEIVERYKGDGKKNIILHVSKENKGYAAGINNAAKYAHGELLVIINPDSELVSFNLQEIVSEFSDDKKLGIAGLKMVDFEGNNEKTAGEFFNPLSFLVFSLGLEKYMALRYSPQNKKNVDFVSGGFVIFRKEVFEKLGGYDEDYFMYVEDMDICYRAKKEGYKVFFLPNAVTRHKGQGSSNREFAIVNIYKGLQIFYTKHGSFFMTLYVKNLLTLKAALIIFIGALLGKKDLVATYSKALKTIV